MQAGVANPHDPLQLVAHFDANAPYSEAVIWTLEQEQTPIYALRPMGAFAAHIYERLREYLRAQHTEGVERVSIPGFVAGAVTLLNGQLVPLIVPDLRGMFSWSTSQLVQAVAGPRPEEERERAAHQERVQDIENFLERVYYELRNLGLAPQERAMNYAATNAFQVASVFQTTIQTGMKLDTIGAERSPIGRPGSDCWDVTLTFFNPSRRLEQARRVYRFTVDVSDVIPVTVGKVRHWDVY
jgi:cyanobactin maturation PatA/PatG family protease